MGRKQNIVRGSSRRDRFTLSSFSQFLGCFRYHFLPQHLRFAVKPAGNANPKLLLPTRNAGGNSSEPQAGWTLP
jgi:hypothetical protein